MTAGVLGTLLFSAQVVWALCDTLDGPVVVEAKAALEKGDVTAPGGPLIRASRQAEMSERAQGCLLGQVARDSLGSLVEFQAPDDIRREYPKSVREFADGGTWNTIAGQPTDDSEVAPSPARMPADQGRYDPVEARKVYIFRLGPDRICSDP